MVVRWSFAFAIPLLACSSQQDSPVTASVDKLELTLRLTLEPGQAEIPMLASDDGSNTWVEAFAEPDQGWGIFLARARVTVTEPGLDANGLRLEGLEVQLITDDYTANGWLLGTQLSFHGAGRAELTERRDAQLSFWEITEMPALVLTDRTRRIQSEFRWIGEAPSDAETPTVWLDTSPASPSVYLHFLHYRRVGVEDEP